jgi:hypothetical protein
VPLRLTLARTDDVLLAVVDVTAYSTGFELELSVRLRRASDEDDEASLLDWDGPPGPGRLRFGIAYADGRTAGGETWDAGEPAGIVLRSRGGGGSSDHHEQSYWVWPLPPPGPVAFVSRWLDRGLAEGRVEVDAGPIVAAAAQSTPLWDRARAGRHGQGGSWMRSTATRLSEAE